MENKTICNKPSVHTRVDSRVSEAGKRKMEPKSPSSVSSTAKTKQCTPLKHGFNDDGTNQHLPPMKKRRLNINFSMRNKESRDVIPSSTKERRRRHAFISEEEFHRKSSIQQEPNEWHDLSLGCIYKLEDCRPIDCRVVGRLTDQYNKQTSVYLPKFFLDRLMARNETNIKVFVQRGEGAEDIDIVTIDKSTCRNCGRDFSSENHMKRHMTLFCKS